MFHSIKALAKTSAPDRAKFRFSALMPGSGPSVKWSARHNARLSRVAAAAGLLALAGCEGMDPLTRPYMWHPGEAVPNNMAAMAANPADLVHGRGTAVRQVGVESDGVDRLWNGRVLPLLGGTGGLPSGATGGATTPSGGGT